MYRLPSEYQKLITFPPPPFFLQQWGLLWSYPSCVARVVTPGTFIIILAQDNVGSSGVDQQQDSPWIRVGTSNNENCLWPSGSAT